MSGEFQRYDPRPGGSYRMVLTYAEASTAPGKTTADSDVVEARFVDIVPDDKVVHAVDFVSDDPAFAGTMTMSWTVTAVAGGTLVDLRADDVPDGISATDHASGLASSLANLAAYVEGSPSPHRVAVPQWAPEDHSCPVCQLSYADISIDHAWEVVAELAVQVREAVAVIRPEALHVRPQPSVWSVAEYLCHLRDVYVSYTIRLHRARTEENPVLEPMLNDLRARRFRYNESDVQAVLSELFATTAGFCEEISHTGQDDWDRVATRPPGQERTARWLVRQAMHEGVHHLNDIRSVGRAAAETS